MEAEAAVNKGMSGQKHDRCNVNYATKRQDELDVVSTVVFRDGKAEFEGKKFLDLENDGRVFAKYGELFLFVRTGRALRGVGRPPRALHPHITREGGGGEPGAALKLGSVVLSLHGL